LATAGPAHREGLVSLLRSRRAPPEIRQYAARGLLPLDADDRLRALLAVVSDPDPAIVQTARETFGSVPLDTLAEFLRTTDATPAEIETIAKLTDDPIVLERVVRHRNISDATLVAMARSVTGTPQEALIVNQARLLRNPALIDALFANPELTADGRRMLHELREEFFEKEARRIEARRRGPEKKTEHEPGPEETEGTGDEAESEAIDSTEAGTEAEQAGGEEGRARGVEELTIRIMQMSVPERVKLALTGSRDERRILIGDSSKMVGMAVLRARGLTLSEIESFCAMRHLDPDIYRKIAFKRDWIRRLVIAQALVKNPKAPLDITMPLVRRLPMRELRNVSRDRNLPEAIRATAKQTYMQKRK
jgi:hypothetical protein